MPAATSTLLSIRILVSPPFPADQAEIGSKSVLGMLVCWVATRKVRDCNRNAAWDVIWHLAG
jgi:hypothetical protein